MLNFYMYSFEKRRNSTKSIPDKTQAKVKSKVCLKEPTSLIRPTVILAADHGTAANHDKAIMACNYAWLLNRFYWITDIQSVTLNHWEITLEVDPMATYKNYILNTNAFICYSARNGNGELIDSRLPRRTNGGQTKTVARLPININPQGTYIISAISKEGIKHYALNSHQQFQSLMNAYETFINTIDDGIEMPNKIQTEEGTGLEGILTTIGEGINYVGDLFVNAFEYIKKFVTQSWSVDNISDNIKQIIWYPFEIPTAGAGNIVFGSFDTEIIGRLVDPTTTLTMTYATPLEAPSPAFEEMWLRRRGYAEWAIHLPFAGTFPLSNDLMFGGRHVQVDYILTIMTGNLDIYVSLVLADGGGSRRVIETHANLACGVMWGSSSIGVRSAASSIISLGSTVGIAGASGSLLGASAAGGLFSVNPAATAQAAMNVVNEAVNDVPCVVGGFSGSYDYPDNEFDIEIYCAYYGVSQSPPSGCAETVGIPMFRQGSLGNESGYVLCNGASVSAPATAGEIDIINQYLNSGAFIE